MPVAFALTRLVLQMWAVFAPVEVTTAEARRRRNVLPRRVGRLALLKWWILMALSTFLRWLLSVVGENSTVHLCGEEVHAVSNDVFETHSIAIFVKILQDSRSQGSVGDLTAER
jgi:hypothetical protein